MSLPALQSRELPPPLPFRKLLGPSFILLGLGLGSGETILWPYLVSNFGFGIIWGALLGITFQFFINMEIARYSLARGESIFAGFARLWPGLPWWFILSTFASFAWPGIIAASGTALSYIFGVSAAAITVGLLITIGLILSLGPVLYKTVERFQMGLVAISIPTLLILAFLLVDRADLTALARGLIGAGDGYLFLPAGIPLLVFLGAFAYSGAAGNLNLAQSFYVKDKGYGMGKFAGRITSPWTGKPEPIRLAGFTFPITSKNLGRFRAWWRAINLEHGLIFWFLGFATIALLALLAYTTVAGLPGNIPSIDFVRNEAAVIASHLHPAIGVLFLAIIGLTLFATQLTVFDSTSRIIAENIVLATSLAHPERLRRLFYVVLWAQIAFAATVILAGFSEPRALLTLQSVLAALTMFVHIGLTYLTNQRFLERELRPSLGRRLVIIAAFLFFGGLSAYSLISAILK